MSWEYGGNYRDNQIPDAEEDCANYDSDQTSRRITVRGRTRILVGHDLEGKHGITDRQIAYVLENWALRGIHTTSDDTQSWNYMAYVAQIGKIVIVAVSVDGDKIVTAFASAKMTRKWRQGDRNYFTRYYQRFEERDGI